MGPSQLKKSRRSAPSERRAPDNHSSCSEKENSECGDRWGLVLMRDVDEGKRSVCSGVGGRQRLGGWGVESG